MFETHSKVRATHLKRDAYLYVRQSTVRQVFESTESKKRQYALRERAVAWGWPIEQVHVIDTDPCQTGQGPFWKGEGRDSDEFSRKNGAILFIFLPRLILFCVN
ncbi:hypothetical protein SBDP1_870005 [Syntrophobacter sp. SbD1]|nr:hypothetical protein SBDP1_870005 [Syntrophobacter sp. SbD1]